MPAWRKETFMQYDLPLSRIPLGAYLTLLKAQTLLPSRGILRQAIEERFAILQASGISNLAQLRECLSTPLKTARLAAQTGIPEAYLLMLRRESGTLVQKPVQLAAFPGLDPMLGKQLAAAGIKTSKEYYETQAPAGMLYCLCDLVRINGVGPSAAVAFYEAGYRSTAAVAAAEATTMLAKVNAVNREKQYYRATLGVKDMQFCIDFAKVMQAYAS